MDDSAGHRRHGATHPGTTHEAAEPSTAAPEAVVRAGDLAAAERSGLDEGATSGDESPLDRFGGALTGVYEHDAYDALRDEWR